ncbi:MAG: indolepyruvate ferredoxin oxidoreductase subunit alpha [Chloroflexi bacterium RIFCSPLOWO2_12_FULL_71_12]|nr:MAG: indolepyruvate ferredoxin oxidoreductase subunit alpha [Chloroflexi bacterium RIFCSPLOWO2_12_FULL_71_12]
MDAPAVLLSGNEAIAQGAREAGVHVAAGYPGTPSTEILEALARLDPDRRVHVEWSTNEKVAIDVALGASLGGSRALVTMKHVGLNVASDTFMTAPYTGVGGGLVIVVADDPGMHSSQNEQDSRAYARMAGVPLLEPADSAECREFTIAAFAISERFDTPVLVRTATRIAHARGLVRPGPVRAPGVSKFVPQPAKYVMLPGNARRRRLALLERLRALERFADECGLHRVDQGDVDVGIVTSGIAYQYVREVCPRASVLKLGLTHPLPAATVRAFADSVRRVIVVEELEPCLEERLRALGIPVEGKVFFPADGELNPERVRDGLIAAGALRPSARRRAAPADGEVSAGVRPPVLCPGCPHVVPFVALRDLDAIVMGDIGCYTLAANEPLSAMDSCVAMGSSIGMACGLARSGGADRPVVAAIGDSTFLHAGIPALIDAVCNGTRITVLVLDNRTTAMTGGQAHAGSGANLRGDPARAIDIAALCRTIGASTEVVDPYDVAATHRALERAVASPGVSVVIADRPCVESPRKIRERPYEVVTDRCVACQLCVDLGCPSILWGNDRFEGRPIVTIETETCSGCTVCAQLCPTEAIVPVALAGAPLAS